MKNVYGSKGNVVAGAKGAVLDMCLFEVFGAGAANTPFYNDLRRQGSCAAVVSRAAQRGRGDLGSGEATHVQREDARGLFDDSEDEATPRPPFSASRERDQSVLSIPAKQPVSGPSPTRPAVDVDAGYFLEYKDGVRTRREFKISQTQIVDLGEWEDLYNQRSLDSVLVGTIKKAMQYAFENKEQTYELPTFKLAPLGLQKPTPGTKAQRLKPEEWKDELAGEYYYYAKCGQHNAAAARSLLGSEVAKKYNFERWPARMLYFSDDDFEGYFLVSSQDNKKDLKAPPRQLKLSMKDIRWQWKHDGCPRAMMGNPSGKQDQVRVWRKFCTTALHKAPHNSLWILADQKEEEALKKQNVALRSYFPLAMAGENVWNLALEFFEKWETGKLLSHGGAKWIVKKKKVKNVKPGVAYIHNDKLGTTEVVYNVPVDPPNKKGKKEKEEGDWFVQVPDPDVHCWKAMESLTDNEKCRVLKKVLACEVVWVQAGSPSLAKLGKLSVQDMVQLVKCDRVLVRLWNYYQFKHGKRPDADWIQRYPFLKSRSAVFRKFESQGLDDELWDNSRKHVSDLALFKDCPSYMGCDQDNSIEVTEKLAGYKKLSVEWRNRVLSVLNGNRLKSREVALAKGIVHIKWKDTGDVTSIASFANDPLEAYMRGAEQKEAVTATKSHTFVLDLCEPIDLKLWKAQAWETLDSYLQTWCPSHCTLIVFVPRQYNLTFLASMHHLSFVKLLEGKWVRRVQQKKSFPIGNNLYTEEGRMYILFKGDDLRANTSMVYEGNLPRGAVAAGSVYGDMERNPTQFVNLLDFLGKKAEGVVFLGEPHVRSVWDLLKAGRHVVAMEGNADLLQFTMQAVKSEVNSGGHNCEFMVVKPTRDKVWSNKTDMWFKLSERKRNKIYDFLFLQTRPRKDSDAEYVRRKHHMFALLDNYHFASRMNAKTFLDRLQSLYFVESEEQLKLASYASLISIDDEEATGVEFVVNVKEEENDIESIDLQYDPPPADHGRGSSSAGPSPSVAVLVSPSAKPPPGTTPMKFMERLRALAVPPPALRPGSDIPPDHPSWQDDHIHFLLEPQRHSPELEWGHDMVWHQGVIQPAIRKGEWVMAVAIPGAGWALFPHESKSNSLHLARISVLQKVTAENDTFAPGNLSLISTAGRLFDELQDKCWLELTEDYHDLDTTLLALGSRSGGKSKSAGIRTTSAEEPPERSGMQSRSGSGEPSKDPEIGSIAARDGNVGNVSPEQERRPQGLQREAAGTGSSDTETTKSAEIRTSSGGGCRPGIVVLLRGAPCTETEGRSASSPPKSLVLLDTLAAGEEGEVGGRQHVTSPKKSRVGGQALDVLALPMPNSPSKERRGKQTGKP
ncbi:hypothetical protein CBR_g17837 [Chara braunii]|uniref:Uncharacterized protein n=1 Tax=Chara braunii TaxID=69332 RepID=A0A388KVM7_CHABU|nr:hypothetical protein CBR_g17837 [Chara braunii]|eukprot:GBG74126.1 hypothetical protein CBR_g17837 [Chara braunii]